MWERPIYTRGKGINEIVSKIISVEKKEEKQIEKPPLKVKKVTKIP